MLNLISYEPTVAVFKCQHQYKIQVFLDISTKLCFHNYKFFLLLPLRWFSLFCQTSVPLFDAVKLKVKNINPFKIYLQFNQSETIYVSEIWTHENHVIWRDVGLEQHDENWRKHEVIADGNVHTCLYQLALQQTIHRSFRRDGINWIFVADRVSTDIFPNN